MPALAPPPAAAAKANPAPIAEPSREAIQSHEPTPESYLGDIGSELEGLDATEPVAEPQKRQTPPKGPDGKFQKAPEKAPERPQDAPKDEKPPEVSPAVEKPVEDTKPSNIRALGKAYDTLKKERDTVWQPKLQSLEAKTKQYEQQIEELRKTAPDNKAINDKLVAVEKENAQLREVVRFADYKKSPEFTEKFERPYNEAWAKAVSEVTQLNLEMEDGSSRKASANDLLALANAPLDQLDDLAQKWFPRSAARVIRHVEKIRDLAEAQDKAMEEAKKGATEFQTKQAQVAQQSATAFRQAYDGATSELTKKYPKWFAPDETDPAGNELLKKGFEFADSVFSANGNMTPEQKAQRLAVVRAKTANHDRLAARLKAVNARVAELEADLAKYEKSEPPTEEAGAPSGGAKVGWYEDIESEIKKLDK